VDKQTVRDIDVEGKTVLVSVDYNVSLSLDGSIEDIYRLQASLPTLRYLLERDCKLVLISHLGRPGGRRDPKLSLKPVAKELSHLLDRPVQFAMDCVGKEPQRMAELLKPGQILLLENLRFHPGEEADDPTFARQLASLGQVFVQDAFGNAHRKHASMDAITKYIPSVAGLLLEKEVDTINRAMEKPKRPLAAIIGGAKVSDKIEVIDNFVKKADHLVIGGAMANTFFLNEHFKHPIGKSKHEENMNDEIGRIIAAIKHKYQANKGDEAAALRKFLLFPDIDVAVTKEVTADAPRREIPIDEVAEDEIIVDFGAHSTKQVTQLVHRCGTVIWNGPLGVTEVKQFAQSSLEVARAIANSKAESILAGGDTAAFVDEYKMIPKFSHVSTGGGASLDLMAGKPLPGVDALPNKPH
jgi:3-phosphoglycerate kinase